MTALTTAILPSLAFLRAAADAICADGTLARRVGFVVIVWFVLSVLVRLDPLLSTKLQAVREVLAAGLPGRGQSSGEPAPGSGRGQPSAPR